MQEVKPLQKLIGEFGKRQAIAGFSIQTFFHTVFGHHIVDGDVFADFSGEIEEGEGFHPVVVVDEFGTVRGIAVEIEKLGELIADCLLIVA